MFQGLHHHLLDDKGRVAFPAPFRQKLQEMGAQDRFILTQSLYEPCLVAWTEAEFEARAKKLRSLPPSNPAVMWFKRIVVASASPMTIDKAGRISVPKELRDYAGLEREVVWAGMDETIELWSKARLDEAIKKRREDAATLEAWRRTLEEHGL